ARRVPLDRRDGHAEIRDGVAFAPRGEVGEEAAIDLRGEGSGVGADFLEGDRVDASGEVEYFAEPSAEAEERHSGALEASGPEFVGAARDRARAGAERPSGAGAEVEREDRPGF